MMKELIPKQIDIMLTRAFLVDVATIQCSYAGSEEIQNRLSDGDDSRECAIG
jgi:hypothetical protein